MKWYLFVICSCAFWIIGCGNSEPKVFTGTAIIRNTADLETINKYDVIDGSLKVSNTTFSELEIRVEKITDRLVIERNSKLVNISFPKLISVRGKVYITKNAELVSAEFPKLVVASAPTNSMTVEDNLKLSTFDMESLEFCYHVYFANNRALPPQISTDIASRSDQGNQRIQADDKISFDKRFMIEKENFFKMFGEYLYLPQENEKHE